MGVFKMTNDKVQVNIEMPLNVKKQLQIQAVIQDTSMKALVIKYILKGLKEDFKDNNLDSLKP
jgi:hypothetical protein